MIDGRILVSDIETTGLIPDLNSPEDFHVMSVGFKNSSGKWQIISSNKFEDVQKVFCNPENVIIMHNGRRYDKPAIEKMFKIEVTATIIDSLALAWYIEPNRGREGKKYGLEAYGEDFGVPKPIVEDWKNLTYEQYENRCREDVKINILLWEKLYEKLNRVYDGNIQDRNRLISILNWIMDCSYKQEEQKIKVDVAKTRETLAYFEGLKEEKIQQLIEAMPKVPVKAIQNKPKVMFKKDGSLSVAGVKWLELLKACNLPEDYEGQIEVIKSWQDPNPNSVPQKKAWLFSLGWIPQTFKHNRDKETNEVKIVEQIMTEEKMLCPSILKLVEKEPAIESLDGLTVLTHRIGILKSFLSNMDENEMISQGLQQLAVTMRWQHSVIVNLPRYTGKGDLRDGRWIRECLIAGEGKKIVQSDLSGIESRTSDHYTFHINPDRIKKTQMPYFDPHTEISVASNLMTADEEIFFVFKSAQKDDESLEIETFSELYKPTDEVRRLLSLSEDEQSALLKTLKVARSKGKTCNYASLYNVGAKTLARNLEISEKEAKKLIESYWEVNFAVKKATESFVVKNVDGEDWVWNPISRFWYNLRNKKDAFSVVNQSSAVYCFNMWVWNCTQMGLFPVTQSHDDLATVVDEEKTEETIEVIQEAMRRVNKQLKLNVELACETQVGDNIAETH